MDVSNPDTWKQQWTAFISAPYIVAPVLMVFGGLVGGLLGRIAGLKGRISVFEDRLKLAAEQAESAREAKEEVATEFETYKAEVAARVENAALGASAARVEGAILRFAAANNGLHIYSALRKKRIAGDSTKGMGASRRTGAACSPDRVAIWITNRWRSLAGDDDRPEHLHPSQSAMTRWGRSWRGIRRPRSG